MPLTPEQRLARAQAITANKEAIGLRNSGIDTNVPIVDVRSVYSNEPKAPGTQNKPVVPAATVNPPAAPKPTIEDVANGLSPTDIPDFTDPYQQFGDYYKSQFETPVDETAIRKASRDRFQAQIDAINQLYNQKLAEAQTQGQGRLGSSRAIQARSGVLGSDFGTAQTANVETYNRGIEDSVRQEQNALVQQILSQANTDATTEIANRRTAMKEGADSYLAFLQGQTERKQARLGGIVQTLFDKGVDPSRLDKATLAKITGSYGTDLGTLSAMYKSLQAEKDAADQAAIDKEIGRTKSLAEIDKLTTETETGRNKTEAETFLKLAEGRLKQLEVENYGQPPRPGTKDYAEYQKLLAETNKLNAEADKAARITGSDLTPGQQSAAFKLTDNYEQASKDTRTITTAYNKILASSSNPTAAGDLSLIFAYMKMLDPTSVVREGEFATAANAGSAFERIGAQYNKILTGERLTEAQRNDFSNRAKSLYQSAQEQQKIVDAEFSAKAQKFGIDPSLILSDLGSYNERPAPGGGVQRDRLEVGGVIYEDDGTGNYVPLPNEGSDSNAQAALGKAQPSPIALAAATKYPVGSTGGQCTTFLHKIASFPPIGDGLNEKKASVDRIGIPKAQWQPSVGDIIVTDDNPTYGHTAMINKLLPGNKAQVTESNWKGNEKVTHSRIVSLTGNNIYGAIRPKSKLKTTLV